MHIVLSLDYEVFFGRHTGTVEHTLLRPSQALCDLAARHRVPLVFFVDIGFLLRLREEGRRSQALMREHDQAMRQLEQFVIAGHEIQLHAHPHWEDSRWNGESWDIDTRRYRLHDFSRTEVKQILRRYADALRAVTGGDGVFAYRAGGWVIQPFAWIRDGLRDAAICIDSTVFAGGRQVEEARYFDFTSAPAASRWFFDDDPLVPKPSGEFLEVPITSTEVSPAFYFRRFLASKLCPRDLRSYGDGSGMPLSRSDLVSKLTRRSSTPVSFDGYKAGFLADACRRHEEAGTADFVVIGHTKLLSRYSLHRLERFLLERDPDEFTGYGIYRQSFANR